MEVHTKIAPKPTTGSNSHDGASNISSVATRSFACFNCANRKTKCDKQRPTCSACQRRQLTCTYEDSAGPRKRKATEDANGRIERFERTLAERGLMEDVKNLDSSPVAATNSSLPLSNPVSREASIQHIPPTGRLIADENNSRYINSTLWRELKDHFLDEIAEEQVRDPATDSAGSTRAFVPGLLSRGLLGAAEDVLKYHPSATDAMRLWKIYAENVEPLCKFLHTPSAHKLVVATCQDLSCASAADQCLLFAIYLLAIFSMNETECLAEFRQTRAVLLSQYDYCLRQALFNALWLSRNHMSTLLAFTMYLSVVRRQSDNRSLWIWTGAGTRIMQRMGIHRDGESLGLGPFHVELRRRLYWHIVSLDTFAGRISGTSDSGPNSNWDTKLPSNINDNQIYPDMTEKPYIRAGATEMMFSLVRIKLDTLSVAENHNLQSSGLADRIWDAREKAIDSAENEIELEFLRYCDPVDPMHALTLMTARSAIAASRLRQRLPLVNRQVPHRETEVSELYSLARRVMDADNSAFMNPQMKPFLWKVRASFRWDALICLLAALARPTFFAQEEREGCWKRIDEFFANHTEILEAQDTLQRTVGRMTLKAWFANPPASLGLEPQYIIGLRSLHVDGVSVAQPQLVNENINKAKMGVYPSPEVDDSFDIDALLNNGMFGTDSDWDAMFRGASMMNFEL